MSGDALIHIAKMTTCPNGERLTGSEKLVAVSLANYHHRESPTFPSVESIAADSLLSVRMTQYNLASLERKGVILRVRPTVQYRGITTYYQFPCLKKKGDIDAPIPEPTLFQGAVDKDAIDCTLEPQGRVQEGCKKGAMGRTVYKEEQVTSNEEPFLAESESGKPLTRHTSFKAAVENYWQSKNSIGMTWDGSDANALSRLLKANPTLSLESFKELLRNRYRSEVNHAQRPRQWLDAVTNYGGGPLNQYGKPKGVANGNTGTQADKKLNATAASTETALRRLSAVDRDGDRIPGRLTG